ncbi:AAA family ATPase [Bosea sp. LjRoot90]|uniref:helix-turn-helix transcriptional regulator n=1 Tax=Bosea sp. LjRoot90 TaxID=3342342 RepID=UPI003ECCF539
MELLEREADLKALAAARDEAIAGQGRIALISGEAGIGKTSLVDRFLATGGHAMRILKGNCDALFTPSPLGPLYDIAPHLGGRLLAQLESETPRAALFSNVLEQIRDPAQPTLLFIEDIHWADEATLDLIRFLTRRIAQTSILVIVTYRDDEIGAQHPLQILLGELASSRATIRIELTRLTVDAVRVLAADQPLDPAVLHRLTSGNPFFITEVLANAGRGIPKTVRDAVLARAAKLSTAGRHVLEAAAVIGSRIEYSLLSEVLGGAAEGLADCIKHGMIEAAGQGVAFRHELVRDAILTDLDPSRRRDLNRLALDGLKAFGVGRGDLALLAHFAEGAGDTKAILEFGPAAARAAAAAGAHRAAAAQYLRVLDFAGAQAPAERAQLFEAYAKECAIVDELAEASRAHRKAVECWRQAGNCLREGKNLAALALPLVRSGQNAAAEDASRHAIEVLETQPQTRELAAAYQVQAHLRMLNRECLVAMRWGRKAIELASHFHDNATIAAAENTVGSAMLVVGDERGRPYLDRSLAIARQAGLEDLIGHAYTNLGACYGEQHQFSEAERHLVEGMAYAADRDLDRASHYMGSWLAITRLYQGRWNEACDIATSLVERPNIAAISRIVALVALGRLRARRGDPGATAALDEALDLALQTNTLQRLAPVHAARAEAAWLAGELENVKAEATAVYDLATRSRHNWYAGELAFWRWRAGDPVAAPGWGAPPFILQIEGDWQGAAEAWRYLGCPYEEARALTDGDAPAQLAALEIFDRLGAAPAAAMLRQRMRGKGMLRIPRGQRASTRQNPFALTMREMEILGCLADGLSNGRIGTQLHISPKTVDHHVSSVLGKLGACTRGEAARIAGEQNVLAQNRERSAAK